MCKFAVKKKAFQTLSLILCVLVLNPMSMTNFRVRGQDCTAHINHMHTNHTIAHVNHTEKGREERERGREKQKASQGCEAYTPQNGI